MSTYCVEADILTNLRGLVSADIPTLAYTLANNLINGKLSRVYTVPFTTTPPLINSLAIILTSYYAMRMLFTESQQNDSKWVKSMYDQAMETLNELAEGKQQLIDSAGTEIARQVSNDVYSNTMDFTPTFGEDETEDQVIDPDKLDELADDRS